MIRGAIAAAALLVSCQTWASGPAVATDNDAATKAADITRKYRLSKEKTECLLSDTADKGSYFFVPYGKITPRDAVACRKYRRRCSF